MSEASEFLKEKLGIPELNLWAEIKKDLFGDVKAVEEWAAQEFPKVKQDVTSAITTFLAANATADQAAIDAKVNAAVAKSIAALVAAAPLPAPLSGYKSIAISELTLLATNAADAIIKDAAEAAKKLAPAAPPASASPAKS